MSSSTFSFSQFLRNPKAQAYVSDQIEESLMPVDMFERLDVCADV